MDSRPVLQDRLFIGNLHPSVDEYTLLQIFTKYGKVTKLDFLFHKSGPLKGKPRGYAFLEYGSNDEAQRALSSANGKMLQGRQLVVTLAHQAPPDVEGGPVRPRKTMMETGRPTTLSMIKSSSSTTGKHKDRTSDKIAMMEAKLRELEGGSSSLPTHPSLPMKPPAPSGGSLNQSVSRPTSLSSAEPPPAKKIKLGPASMPADVAKRKSGGGKALGVKIVKKTVPKTREEPGPSVPE